MTTVSLRTATRDDIKLLRHWDTKPHVIASGGDDDTMDWEYEVPRQVPWREILIGEVDGRPIGAIVIIDPAREETHYWGDIDDHLRALDIWIGDEADLGHGFGTAMMKQAIARCFADPTVEAVLVDPLLSNTRAQRFYERLGFVRGEQRVFGQDTCIVYRLKRLQVT